MACYAFFSLPCFRVPCLTYAIATSRSICTPKNSQPVSYNKEHGTAIAIRQVKYLNNVVEQDHRGVKRVTRPILGFKSFEATQDTLVGIELMYMIKKRQMRVEAGDEGLTAAELFYSLAA
jgi:transposase-like protein